MWRTPRLIFSSIKDLSVWELPTLQHHYYYNWFLDVTIHFNKTLSPTFKADPILTEEREI